MLPLLADLRAVDAERVCGGAGVPRRDGLL
jgi:hypothetical protein